MFLEYGEVYDRYTLTDKYSDETDDENEGVSYTKPIRDLADDPEPTVRIQPYYEQYFERDKKGVLWECRELKFQRVPVDLQRYDESDAAYQQRLRSYKVALEKADELLKKTLEAGRKPVWCKRAKEPKR